MDKSIFLSKFKNNNNNNMRYIRSFVLRQGRLTKGQQKSLKELWSIMVLDYQSEQIDLNSLFGRNAPVVLEIGFGMGESLVSMASCNPHKNFLGIEVYLPGVGACLAAAHKSGINNLRIICHDAIDVLNTMIVKNSLYKVQLFFPDPWQKRRHNKRRIIQLPFLNLVMQGLKPGGLFHIATDCKDYAQYILKIISGIKNYKNQSESGDYILRPDYRPLTKFEQRGKDLGHHILDLLFTIT